MTTAECARKASIPRTETTKPQPAIKNVLLATDFSEVSGNALERAAALAGLFGARLFAVHVKEPANYALPPESWHALDEACERNTRELQDKLRKSFPQVQAEVLIGEGNVWQTIAATVEQKSIDLLVVGTHGRNGLGKMLLGSGAEEILRHISVPVLTVGPHAVTKSEPEMKLSEILYATDFSPESQAAADYALFLAKQFDARLTLLHVIPSREKGKLVAPPQLLEPAMRQLRDMLSDEFTFWRAPRHVAEYGDPSEKILEVSERFHAGMIVLGARKPEGVPGAATHLPIATAHKVIAKALCPVLTLRHELTAKQAGN